MYTLLALAVLPAIALMVYVYKKDAVEREPPALIVRVAAIGALGCVVAGLVEMVVIGLFENTLSGWPLLIAECFIGVAVVEEAVKYFALNTVRKHPEFNYAFDGIVYGVAAALGFAALENIMYVFDGGLGVAFVRAVFSVPGHAADGVIMGCFFGIARRLQVQGKRGGASLSYLLAFVLPVLEHGFYDMALSTESDAFAIVALAFDLVFIGIAFLVVRHMSIHDAPIYEHAAPESLAYMQNPMSMPFEQTISNEENRFNGEVVQNPYYQSRHISGESDRYEG